MGQDYRLSQPAVARETAARKTIERLPFIDGLRGIAAVVVCLGHCVFFSGLLFYVGDIRDATLGEQLARLVAPGTQMVWLFLMVSSFSLFYSEDVRRLNASPTAASVFFRRRAWRILPTYYGALALGLSVTIIAAGDTARNMFPNTEPTLSGLVSHLFLVHNLRTEIWSFQINRPLWSMGYEAQLYLIFPLLYFAVRRNFLTGFAAAAGVFFAVHIMHFPTHLILLYWFVLGAVAAAAYREIPERFVPVLLPIGLVSLTSAWMNLPFTLNPAVAQFRWSLAFIPLLLWMARRPRARLNPCNLGPVRWIGLRSYSLYALHFPVLWLLYLIGMRMGLSGVALLPMTLVLGFPLSVGLAMLAYKYVELPSLKRARSVGSRHDSAHNRAHNRAPASPPTAIFLWGLAGGAFSNLAAALASGVHRTGGGPVDLLYLWAGPTGAVEIPPTARLIPLNVRRSAAAPVALARYLRREQPRVLITMPTVVTLPALLGYRLAGRRVRRNTRFVVYQGDTLSSDIAIEHSRSPRLRMMPFLAKRLFPWADALTTCAPGVLELLKRDGIPLPHGRAEVIANPVDVAAYRRRGAEPASHPWITDKTGPVITTLGRLAKRKNHPMLLRAVADVRRSGIDARLVIIGAGPELETTRAVAAELGITEAVSFPGFLPNPHADIARSDLFVMSSLDEAFCLALVEAMACGTPVVSTDAIGGGPRFILTGDGGTPTPAVADADILRAVLIPHDDDAALAAAIHRTLTDADFRARLSAAGWRRADDFSPDAIGRQWVRFLDSLT